MGFDTHDLLRQAGYSEGDYIWAVAHNRDSINSTTTTNTTYTSTAAYYTGRINWAETLGANRQTQVAGSVFTAPGTDETLDVRVRNLDDNETVLERTGITSSGWIELAPTDYTPASTGSDRTFRWQIKTDPGTNSSSITGMNIKYGVKL